LEQAVVRGSELLKQGKLDQAQRAFRAALEIDPDSVRVLALLGLSHFRANELAEAREVYEQLVDRTPTDASHRLNLGLVYLKLNDADRAIGALEASRALDPSQGRAVSYLGLAYARAGRYSEAYRAFLIAGQNDLAVEIESNVPGAERDRIHVQLGRTPQGPLPPVDAAPAVPAPPPAVPAPQPAGAASAVVATAARTPTPASVPRAPTPTAPRVAPPADATTTPPGGTPRTKPPSAPPAKSRTPSQELPAVPPPESASEITITSERDGALRVDAAPAAAPAVANATAPSPASRRDPSRVTDSMQFVMPRADPVAPHHELDGVSMISREVALARPTVMIGPRTKTGGVPPRPLSELATDELLRPDDGDDAFEIGANGSLIIRVTERVMTRLDGVHLTGGDLGYELAMRRSRGHNTEEPFDHGGSQLHAVTGRGYLIAVPGKHVFSAVSLDDDILYLREDLVFAFQASLRWENGNVPGLRGKLPVVQFRGDGALAMRLARPLVRVKLPPQGMVFVDAERLAGWIGRVIPRAVVPPAGGPLGAMCVECTGEGIVLVEPAPDDQLAAPRGTTRPRHTVAEVEAAMVAPVTPPRPTGPTEIERTLAAGDGDTDGCDPAADLLERLDEL
jgi:hypothetical protein